MQKLLEPLPFKVYRHQSKLRRTLSGRPEELLWQDNKVINHSLAIPHIHGVLIRPGETFSFWRLVGPPLASRGYRVGMQLKMGQAVGGVGGGLCQLGNLIHWLALHSPLEVVQRSSHSFDPFPDQGRVIPYGTGAALLYNFVDLCLYNPTQDVFQLRLWLTDTLVHGEIRSDTEQKTRIRILEKNSRFERRDRDWFRHNEIWREISLKGENAQVICVEKLYENHVKVMYEPVLPPGEYG